MTFFGFSSVSLGKCDLYRMVSSSKDVMGSLSAAIINSWDLAARVSGIATLVPGGRAQSTNNCHYLSVANRNICVLCQSTVVPSTVIGDAFQAFSENHTVFLTDFTSKFIFTLLHSFCT